MLARPGATDTVPTPSGASPPAAPPFPPAFLRALGHCWGRALLVGAACAAVVVVPCRLALPAPAVQARIRLTRPPALDGPAGAADLAPLRRELAALVTDGSTLAAAIDEPSVVGLGLIRERPSPARWLGSALDVQAAPGGDTVEVSLRAEPGGEAAVVVNAVAERAAAEFTARQRSAAAARLDAGEADARAARARLEAPKARLREVVAAAGSADAANLALKQRLTLEQLADADGQLRQVRTRRGAAEAELAGRPSSGESVAPPTLDDLLAADDDWARLKESRARVVADIERLEGLAQPGRVPPKLAEYRAALAAIDREIAEHRERVRQRLSGGRPAASVARVEKEIAGCSQAEARLAAEVRRLETEDRKLLAAVAEAERLNREIVAAEAALRAAEAEARTRAEEVGAPARATLEGRAEAPAGGAGRDARSALAAACAFVVVFAGYGWRESRARRVYSAGDVARAPRLRLFATLPPAAHAVRRRLAGASPPARDTGHRRLTEAADAARTQLLHEMGPGGLRAVMVTSAAWAEGKTSLAVLLAVSLARSWRRTLLIDANLRRPAAHRVFGLPAEPGLAEVLRGEAAVAQVIQATPVSRLWALPAGRLDDHALQALAQDDVGPLLAELRGQYDFVVIDTAPVLPVADTLMLARHVDAVLLAVLCGASRLPTVEAARARLEALGAWVLGAVVACSSAAAAAD